MRKSAVLALFAFFCLSGCAGKCFDQLLYKPTTSDQWVSGRAYTNQNGLWLTPVSGITIQLRECGWAYRRPDKGPVSVCIDISSNGAHSLALTEQPIDVTGINGVSIGRMQLAQAKKSPGASASAPLFTSARFPTTTMDTLFFSLPDLLVDGKASSLPKVTMRRTIETICIGPS